MYVTEIHPRELAGLLFHSCWIPASQGGEPWKNCGSTKIILMEIQELIPKSTEENKVGEKCMDDVYMGGRENE